MNKVGRVCGRGGGGLAVTKPAFYSKHLSSIPGNVEIFIWTKDKIGWGLPFTKKYKFFEGCQYFQSERHTFGHGALQQKEM